MRVLACGLVLAAVVGAAARGAGPAEGKEPALPTVVAAAAKISDEQIRAAVGKLGSAQAAEREEAEGVLRAAGKAALPAIEAAVKESKDSEVVARGTAMVEEARFGLDWAVDKKVQELVRAYRAAPVGEQVQPAEGTRLKLIEGLSATEEGRAAAIFMLLGETHAVARYNLRGPLQEARNPRSPALTAAGPLVRQGRMDAAAALFRRIGGDEDLRGLIRAQHGAALAWLTGTADAQIAAAETSPLARVMLCRAKGDTEGALKAARSVAESYYLVPMVLAGEKRWKDIAELPLPLGEEFNDAALCRLAALEFAGRRGEADQLVATHQGTAGIKAYYAQRLCLLGRTDEALAVLKDGDPLANVELLVQLGRYREAAALADATREKPQPKPDWRIDARVAHAMALVNERERALALMAPMDEIPFEQHAAGMKQLITAANALLGRTDRISQNYARLSEPGRGRGASTIDIYIGAMDPAGVAPPRGRFANSVDSQVKFIDPALPALDRFERTVKLAQGAYAAEEVDRHCAALLEPLRPAPGRAMMQLPYPYLLFASDALHVMGRADLARRYDAAYLASIPSAGAPYALPTDAFDTDPRVNKAFMRGDWETALARYQALHERFPNDAVYAYVLGICLAKTGKAEEGQRLLNEGHTGALADPVARLGMARLLIRAGLPGHARVQVRMLDLFGEPLSRERWAGFGELAEDRFARGDYGAALHAWQQAIFIACQTNLWQGEWAATLRMAARVALCEAHLAGNKADDVAAYAATALRVSPEDLGPIAALIVALDAKGQAAGADAVFRAARVHLDAVLKDYPNSHRHHNMLAALCADAGRDMADGASHLARAMELAPENKEYRATRDRFGHQHDASSGR